MCFASRVGAGFFKYLNTKLLRVYRQKLIYVEFIMLCNVFQGYLTKNGFVTLERVQQILRGSFSFCVNCYERYKKWDEMTL